VTRQVARGSERSLPRAGADVEIDRSASALLSRSVVAAQLEVVVDYDSSTKAVVTALLRMR
jgi:hypothetical protein